MRQDQNRREEKMTMVSREEQKRGPGWGAESGTLRKAGRRKQEQQRKFSLLLKQFEDRFGRQMVGSAVFVKPTGRVH